MVEDRHPHGTKRPSPGTIVKAIKSLLAALLVGAILLSFAFADQRTALLSAGAEALQLEQRVTTAPLFATLGNFPSLDGATGWLNSAPLTRESLRGKVVLVQFWTYSCINWRRTNPYVRAWAEKYKKHGLVVIGVHAPEFEFEKNVDNVREAARDTRVDFPIAVDNDHAIWRAFDNDSWPALYFLDAEGRIRYRRFGEGEYDKSERVIQQLLAEAGATSVDRSLVAVEGTGAEAAPDWKNVKSPENYLGYGRTQGFVSPSRLAAGEPRLYVAPARLRLNQWALTGDWTVQRHSVVANQAQGRMVYRFRARDLHMVMGPAVRGADVRFRVLVDGQPPGAAHGIDVDDQGRGTITGQRMYQLIRQVQPIVERQFEIEFLDVGAEAFALTFG